MTTIWKAKWIMIISRARVLVCFICNAAARYMHILRLCVCLASFPGSLLLSRERLGTRLVRVLHNV